MSTFILKTVEILCDILLQYIERTLPLILFGGRKTIKSRRSIIRAIGTILPLPSPERTRVNVAKWRQEVPEILPPQCSDIDEVTPSVPDQETIKYLENELELLKRQVAFILENQKNYSVTIPKIVVSAPIPPPPPPPLPPPPMLTPLTPLKFSKPLGVSTPKNVKKPAAIDALINEMKNGLPKLKPIKRSPGGRPIKPPRLIDDPSDVLAEVLKKRFNVSQYSDDSELSLSFNTEIQKDSFQ